MVSFILQPLNPRGRNLLFRGWASPKYCLDVMVKAISDPDENRTPLVQLVTTWAHFPILKEFSSCCRVIKLCSFQVQFNQWWFFGCPGYPDRSITSTCFILVDNHTERALLQQESDQRSLSFGNSINAAAILNGYSITTTQRTTNSKYVQMREDSYPPQFSVVSTTLLGQINCLSFH